MGRENRTKVSKYAVLDFDHGVNSLDSASTAAEISGRNDLTRAAIAIPVAIQYRRVSRFCSFNLFSWLISHAWSSLATRKRSFGFEGIKDILSNPFQVHFTTYFSTELEGRQDREGGGERVKNANVICSPKCGRDKDGVFHCVCGKCLSSYQHEDGSNSRNDSSKSGDSTDYGCDNKAGLFGSLF